MEASASGDDGSIRDTVHGNIYKLKDSILKLSSRTKSGSIGLGQCIKEVIVGDLHTVDFCSKWVLADEVTG
mgnify:CR=1 FL=1